MVLFVKFLLHQHLGSLSYKSQNSNNFSKLVDWVKSYEPPKCSTVIGVNWDQEMGRSTTDLKFRVYSSLFRSLWIIPPSLCKMLRNRAKSIFLFQVEAAREHFEGLDIPWIKTPHTKQCYYKPQNGERSCSEDFSKMNGMLDGLSL
jgi:hypothetical protein